MKLDKYLLLKTAKDNDVYFSEGLAARRHDAKVQKKIDEKSEDLRATASSANMNKLLGTAVGTAAGLTGNLWPKPEDYHNRTNLPLIGVGATNGYYLAKALGAGTGGRRIGAVLGGIAHPLANYLAHRSVFTYPDPTGAFYRHANPLFHNIMSIYNPIAGGIAGYLLANDFTNSMYNAKVKDYDKLVDKQTKDVESRSKFKSIKGFDPNID